MQKIHQQGVRDRPQGERVNEPIADEAAAYIADLLIELREMASSARLGFLAYLLSLAAEEARRRDQSE